MTVATIMADTVEVLLRANLAAGTAILVVVALRKPARRLFGAEVAYGLWTATLLAAATAFLPARSQLASVASAATPLQAWAVHSLSGLQPDEARSHLLLGLWLAGVALMTIAFGWSQIQFLRRERLGQAGPAVVGVISPRFVVPADYEARFTWEERQIIRAHERTHMDRGDALANAMMAAIQVLCWFNPLVHLAARLAREDQELACDAEAVKRIPVGRRRYAETLLKTQLAPTALPLGCHWPAPAPHPLEERIGMLSQAAPGARRRLAGQAAVLALALGAGGAGWMARPVHAVPAAVEKPVRLSDHVMLFKIYRTAPSATAPGA